MRYGPRCLQSIRLTAVAMALLPATLLGVVQPTHSPELGARTFRAPELEIGDHYVPWSRSRTLAAALGTTSFEAFGSSPDMVFVDERTGRIGTLIASLPVLPGRGNQLSWQELGASSAPGTHHQLEAVAWPQIQAAIAGLAPTLGIDVDELATPGKVTALDGGTLVHVFVGRQVDGVPVRGSYLSAVIRHGNLVLTGAHSWADVTVARAAQLSAASAEERVRTHLGDALAVDGWRREPHLELIPVRQGGIELAAFAPGEGLTYRLAWVLYPRVAGQGGEWEALIDAANGDLISFADTIAYGTGEPREVVGGVYPEANDQLDPQGTIQPGWPMPFAFVTNGPDTHVTDSGGNLNACVDGTIAATLEGPYVRIDDECGAVNESDTGAVLDLEDSGAMTDCIVPAGHSAGDTQAARTGFYELNRLFEVARSHTPEFDFLHSQLLSNMNIAQTCNAGSGAGGLSFFKSGGGCRNTGEIAGIFDHEWGHSFDRTDSAPGVSSPGEGIADIYASLRLNTSCIGRGFRSTNCGGYGNACTGCTGVRDIDWADHTANTPIVVTGTGATAIENCGFGDVAPCGGSVHCEGQVYSQAVWDLWNRDLTNAPFSFNVDRTREIAARLTFNGATNVGQWYNCSDPNNSTQNNAVADGCNANGGYLNYLAADDTDGNLANGTPHMSAIFAAFNRHGIACPTPAVATSGCAGRPTTAPSVTVTPVDRSALVEWTAVTGAQSYRVLRADGLNQCDFGKAIVAEVAASAPRSFYDTGLKNGRDYSYQVVAVGAGDTCFGPVSTCQTTTPAAAGNLAGVVGSEQVTVNTGDADTFFDNCEAATLTFDVENTGNAALTDLEIVSIDGPPGLFVNESLPKAVTASLAQCGTTTASLDIYLAFQPTNGVVEFTVNLLADELGGVPRPVAVTLSGIEGDVGGLIPSHTYGFEVDLEDWEPVEGTIVRATAGGGASATSAYLRSSSLLNLQCDRGRSPLMVLDATSTLSLSTNYAIESTAGGPWDRANVSVVEPDGTRTVVTPSSGRAYDIPVPSVNGGCLNGEAGWANTNATWAASNWSAGALGSAGLAGQPIQLEVAYATDELEVLDGFRFDQVTITNVRFVGPDGQSNLCNGGPFIFSDGFESNDTSAWTTTLP